MDIESDDRLGRPKTLITFALWDTLITENPLFEREVIGWRCVLIARALKAGGYARTYRDIGRAYNLAAREVEETWKRGGVVDNESRIRRILEELESPLDIGRRLALQGRLECSHSKAGIELIRGAKELVQSLASCYRLAIVSDTWMTPGSQLRGVLEYHQLLTSFQQCLFSDETGLSKVSSAAFVASARAFATDPGQAIHIGDNLRADVGGAARAGIGKTVFVRRDGHPLREADDEEGLRATISVEKLEEVPSALELAQHTASMRPA